MALSRPPAEPGGGVFSVVPTDVLAVGTSSNIGAYGVVAAIALLTKKRWLQYGMFGVAGVGVAIGAAAMLHI